MTDEATGGSPHEPVDWDAVDHGTSVVDRWLVLRVVPFALLAAVIGFDAFLNEGAVVAGWYPTPFDWLTAFTLAVVVAGPVVSMLRRPASARRTLGRVRNNRAALLAVSVLLLFALVAVVQPMVTDIPDSDYSQAHQPPVSVTVDGRFVPECTGPTVQSQYGQDCTGTWEHPLGTNDIGRDVIVLLAAAINVSMRFALVVSALSIPLAVSVGVLAGYAGGRVDDVLMRYVDVQQAIPAFLVYVIVGYFTRYTLFNIAVVFGLFSWGNVARLVRSETLQRKEASFVVAARNAGASHLGVIRRHILPNVSGTVLTGLTLQIPMLLLSEAALGFLKFGDFDRQSFGTIIREGLQITFARPGTAGFAIKNFVRFWWVSGFGVLALATMVVTFNVLGDALRDVFDPRTDT